MPSYILLFCKVKLSYSTTNWRRGGLHLYFATMATLNAPFPDLFLPCPGEPSIPFTTWIRMFHNYLPRRGSYRWCLAKRKETSLAASLLRNWRAKDFYTLPETGDTLDSAHKSNNIAALRQQQLVAFLIQGTWSETNSLCMCRIPGFVRDCF